MMGEKIAVFLDRDGVINEEKGYITKLGELNLFPYTFSCIRRIHELGYLAIVISNQGGIAKGIIDEDELTKINDFLISKVGIDEVYYCPHHPKGIVSRYSKVCECRKPNTGLIEKAVKKYNINVKSSIMVGDRASDIEAGINMGMKTILLESGYGLSRMEYEINPDYLGEDLRDVIRILEQGCKV